MASVRIAVEWDFGRIAMLFGFLRYAPNQRSMQSNVGHQFVVATLMKNIHVCVNRGNQISDYFGVQPPTLDEYMDSTRLITRTQ